MFLLKIGFSRITLANLNGSRQNFTGVCSKLKSHVLKFWRRGPKGRKIAVERVGVFVTGTMNSHFIVMGQIGMKSGLKRQLLSSIEQ